MVKPNSDVIKEFNELVNMTADELEKWLKSKDSQEPGWTGGSGGETVGHDSGNKITDILRRNPDKKDDKYTEEDIKHMRKVVSYNKRHLAQEEHLKESKSEEELKKTKSYKSLKTTGAAPSSTFRSDVTQPTALRTGKIGATSSAAAFGEGGGGGASGQMASQEYLDRLEEGVNKTIDGDVETLLESFKELISLATIGDKDKFQIEQEAFQADARADAMVRAAQNLSLLSESLKLSLLLSKTPDSALNDEAIELMKNTELEKIKCAHLLERILHLSPGRGAAMVEEIEAERGDGDGSSSPPASASAATTTTTGSLPESAQDAARTPTPPDTTADKVDVEAEAEDDEGDEEELEMEDVSMG